MALSLNYLASHSRNLESLLQTYRQINLTTQSVLYVLGTFLLSRILETQSVRMAVILEGMLVVLTFFSNLVMRRFQSVIRARGDDVNWWHRKIVKAELALPVEERSFTEFKLYQSRARLTPTEIASYIGADGFLPEEKIDELLDADLDHIRKVINSSILRGIDLMWGFLILLSIGGLALKCGFPE